MRAISLLILISMLFLAGCKEGNSVSDISQEKSPSAGKADVPSTKVDGTKTNPAAGYPKSAAGQGDSLKAGG